MIPSSQIHVTPVQPQRPSWPEFLPDLKPKEIELLVTARNDSSGQINHLKAVGTEQLYVGKRTFIKQQNARAVAEWLGAVNNLVAMGLFEAGGPHGLFYRLTQSGFAAADLLEDFCRWSSAEVTIEARYVNAPLESLKIACTGIVKLPATYYEYRVRAGEESMKSEKEPQSLLLEGVDITELNGITCEPTDLSFAVDETKEMRSFLVERATDHKIAKFWISEQKLPPIPRQSQFGGYEQSGRV